MLVILLDFGRCSRLSWLACEMGERVYWLVNGRNPVGEKEEPKVTGEFDRCGTRAAIAGSSCSLLSVGKSQRSPRASARSQGGHWAFGAHLWRGFASRQRERQRGSLGRSSSSHRIDGKSLRGNNQLLKGLVQAVRAWTADSGLTLAQEFVSEKSNEIIARYITRLRAFDIPTI